MAGATGPADRAVDTRPGNVRLSLEMAGLRNVAVEPPESLKAGRRALDGVGEITLLDDWSWDSSARSWWLHGRITVEIDATDFVPRTTDWYIKAPPTYPWGAVVFYPASTGGLKHTFWHQNYNGDGSGDSKWRQGRLCVDTGMHSLGKPGYDEEPFDEHGRLEWHVRRVVEWIREASAGGLAQPGDPFELPDFRQIGQTTLALNETRESFAAWNEVKKDVGLADLACAPGIAGTEYVRSFRTGKKTFSTRHALGHISSKSHRRPAGGDMDSPPVGTCV